VPWLRQVGLYIYIYIHIHIRGIHFHDDDNTDDCQNVGLLAVHPTDKAASPKMYSSGLSTYIPPVGYPGILFGGEGGSTNSVEDRGQRERGSGGSSPLVRGSGGSCNLVQEIPFHIVKFS